MNYSKIASMERYLHLDAEELALDADFIKYTHNHPEAVARWERWLSEHPDKQATIVRAKRIVQAITPTEQIDAEAKRRVWARIQSTNQKTQTQQSPKQGIVKRLWPWISIAAAACVALLVYMNLPQSGLTRVTAMSEKLRAHLPAGSVIDLNSQSNIVYEKNGWGVERKVRLEGEAFFKVKKGVPFQVMTDHGVVKVLGTSFNVYNRGERFMVHCVTGKVSVSVAGKDHVLTPGEGVEYLDGELKGMINPQRAQWRQGRYTYDGEQAQLVIDDLEKAFSISIENTASFDKNIRFTGAFETSDLNKALESVFWPLGMTYQKVGDRILISKE